MTLVKVMSSEEVEGGFLYDLACCHHAFKAGPESLEREIECPTCTEQDAAREWVRTPDQE